MLLLLLSRFSHVQLCTTPQTAAHKATPSLGFSRQEHWSGFNDMRIIKKKKKKNSIDLPKIFIYLGEGELFRNRNNLLAKCQIL